MAAFRVYPGRAGMARSLRDLDQLIDSTLTKTAGLPAPKTPHEMLHVEEERLRLGAVLADLRTAKDIVALHMDSEFKRTARADARRRFRKAGVEGPILDRGWDWTTFTLRNGLQLSLRTCYLRPSRKGLRGRPREKRGPAGSGSLPFLEALGITDQATPALHSEASMQIVRCCSYEEAKEQFARAGVELDISVFVRIAVATGMRAIELRQQALDYALNEALSDGGPLAGKRVRISMDGGRVHVRKIRKNARKGKNGRRKFDCFWREPRLITIEILDAKGKPDPEFKPIYELTLGNADQVFELLTGLLRLLGAHQAEVIEFVADGAPWMWSRIDALFEAVGVPAERVRLVLDYYHACEHVADALAVCKNFDATKRASQYEKLSRMMLGDDGPERVIEELRALARGRRASEIKDEIAYLEGHLPHLRYAELRAEHLPIGSGVVESGIRRVVNLRFKSASMLWKEEHVEPLLYLMAILKSGRWDSFIEAFLDRRYHLVPGDMDFCMPAIPYRWAA